MKIKGYDVPGGFMGWLDEITDYRLFASYRDYVEYVTKEDEDV